VAIRVRASNGLLQRARCNIARNWPGVGHQCVAERNFLSISLSLRLSRSCCTARNSIYPRMSATPRFQRFAPFPPSETHVQRSFKSEAPRTSTPESCLLFGGRSDRSCSRYAIRDTSRRVLPQREARSISRGFLASQACLLFARVNCLGPRVPWQNSLGSRVLERIESSPLVQSHFERPSAPERQGNRSPAKPIHSISIHSTAASAWKRGSRGE